MLAQEEEEVAALEWDVLAVVIAHLAAADPGTRGKGRFGQISIIFSIV